jgi:hypothetical protein
MTLCPPLFPGSAIAQSTAPDPPPSLSAESPGGFEILALDLPVSPSEWQLPNSGYSRTSPRPGRDGTAVSVSATARVPQEVRRGALIGAVAGAAFGLWVVNFADCDGSGCASQRVVGMVAFTGVGAAIGGAMGGLRRLSRR